MCGNTCHRHSHCQGCEDEATAFLVFVWSGVVLGLVVLAWIALT